MAGVLTTGAWLPQLIRCWLTRSRGDISWGYLIVLGTGVSLWVTYGIVSADSVVIVANVVTLVALAVLAILKWAFVRKSPQDQPLGH